MSGQEMCRSVEAPSECDTQGGSPWEQQVSPHTCTTTPGMGNTLSWASEINNDNPPSRERGKKVEEEAKKKDSEHSKEGPIVVSSESLIVSRDKETLSTNKSDQSTTAGEKTESSIVCSVFEKSSDVQEGHVNNSGNSESEQCPSISENKYEEGTGNIEGEQCPSISENQNEEGTYKEQCDRGCGELSKKDTVKNAVSVRAKDINEREDKRKIESRTEEEKTESTSGMCNSQPKSPPDSKTWSSAEAGRCMEEGRDQISINCANNGSNEMHQNIENGISEIGVSVDFGITGSDNVLTEVESLTSGESVGACLTVESYNGAQSCGVVGCGDQPMRDTDSEAGDSCCSDEHEHGEACRGEGGCVHQEGMGEEHAWEIGVDEEFNVPRRPIFNGSADHIERRSSLKRKASEEPEDPQPTKCKRGIQFEGVTVFYFPRSQGFTCVPSQGGSSLGMSRRHSHIRQFSLAEHAVEQRRAHREHLLRLRQQRSAREHGESSSRGSSSEDSEENSEEASDLSDSELDADSYYFLQPLPIRQRRTLLRQAGICHIEGLEKEECKDIRISREMCGCQCKVHCDPDTCQCAQAGIKCQVDRHNFPCGCSREGCGNFYGRIEFNPIRVRTHFIHTLMRLELEKRQAQRQQQQQQQQQQIQQQQHQQQHHQHQQQQHQEWQHQQQQRAKWLASSTVPVNGFTGGGGGSSNLPFFEGGRESVADVTKFNSSAVEMGPCVASMNASLYPHFEARQMVGPATPAVYVQHDGVSDYNAGTCSVFGGLSTATFDPSGGYGSCHGFPSGAVVQPPPQVNPQVAPSQPAPPEAYNALTKFANTGSSLVSASFPYGGGGVNCSYPQSNFCMTVVHDNTNSGVFGQYHEAGVASHNLFKSSVNECGEFQPNFEVLSSPTQMDKVGRYLPAPSMVVGGKEGCGEMGGYASEAIVSGSCPNTVEERYKMAVGGGGDGGGGTSGSSSSCSTSPHQEDQDLCLPQLPVGPPPPSLPLPYDHTSPGKDTSGSEDPTEAGENLGEIVKKSMVETVSA